MKNKKMLALIILGIAAVASLIYGIVTPPAGRGPAEEKKAALSSSGGKKPVRTPPVKAKVQAARSKFKSWKRRPFVPPNAPSKSPDLVLSGIFGSAGNLKAIIGPDMVSKGDKVGNITVVDVKNDRVILNDGAKDFELVLSK
jgi:hypothetical protein